MAQVPSFARVVAQVLFAVSAVAIGQLCMRRGMVALPPLESMAGIQAVLAGLLEQPAPALWAAAGIAAYLLATLAWLQVLAHHELSFVFPFTSISYVLVYIGAVNWPVLGEQAGWLRSAGVALIVCGVALVARSGRARSRI